MSELKDEYKITLTWCKKHKSWGAADCPDCMLDFNEPTIRKDVRDKVCNLIDCEIDCIRSGNALTPIEQDIAIKVCKNIKQRIEETA